MSIPGFIILAGGIFFLLFLPGVFLHAKHLSKRFGPAHFIDSPSCAKGNITCKAFKAPSLGRDLSFEYAIRLTCIEGKITGEFKSPAYQGHLFLEMDNAHVSGRVVARETRVVEGTLDRDGGELTLGFPRKSGLSFLNGRLNFSIQDNVVHCMDTNNSQGCILEGSKLYLQKDRVFGELLHYRESWTAKVNILSTSIAPEAASLCVLLMANAIMGFHHD